jgi:hypothetical protein
MNRSRTAYIFLLIILLLIPLIGQSSVKKDLELGSPVLGSAADQIFNFNFTKAYEHIETQLSFGSRVPGTSGSNATKQFIRDQLSPIATIVNHEYLINEVPCTNIIAKMNVGKGPIIVFSGHFDNRKIAEKDPYLENRTKETPGANDGAGSVAVVIELIKAVYPKLDKLNYEIWGVFFDAEDQGSEALPGWNYIEGSKRMVEDMKNNPGFFFGTNSGKNISSIHRFVLLDMVCGTNLKLIYEKNSNQLALQSIFDTAQRLGYSDIVSGDKTKYSITDDHVPFAQNGITTVDLIINFWNKDAGWPYHHTTNDTIENIDINSIKKIGYTLETWLKDFYIEQAYVDNFDDEPNNTIDGFNPWHILIIGLCCLPVYSKIVFFKRNNTFNE